MCRLQPDIALTSERIVTPPVRRRCAPASAMAQRALVKPRFRIRNSDQKSDFSFWRAARQSAQKRSAPRGYEQRRKPP
jgi:hypothetical protein